MAEYNKITSITTLNPFGNQDSCCCVDATTEGFIQLNNVINEQCSYAFSCWIYSPKTSLQIFVGSNEYNVTVTQNKWSKIEIVIESNVFIGDYVQIEIPIGRTLIYNSKLEKGNRCSDWTESQSDIDENIANVTYITNGKTTSYYSDIAPKGLNFTVNDIWFDTSKDCKMYFWNGSAWQETLFGTEALKAESITSKLIASEAVTAGKISAGAVVADKIASNAITSDKIQANAITAGKIAVGAINANHIQAGTIKAENIATDAITADKISSKAITTDKINSEAITADKILAKCIDATKINASSIAGAVGEFIELSASQITSGKIKSTQIDVADLTATEAFINAISTNRIVVSASENSSSALEKANASISNQTMHYLATSKNDGVTKSTSGWTTTTQSVTETNKYLWTYVTYTKADGNTFDSTPVITGVYGDKGSKGEQGAQGIQGIQGIQGEQGEQGEKGDKGDKGNQGDKGDKGDKGQQGVGVSNAIMLYYQKANATYPTKPTTPVTTTSGSYETWTKTLPTYRSDYPYYFTCMQTLLSDGNYTWSDVVIDNALRSANKTAYTADELANDIVDNIYVTGTVEIDGGKIKADTIEADRIKSNSITTNQVNTTNLAAGIASVISLDASRITAGTISTERIDGDNLVISGNSTIGGWKIYNNLTLYSERILSSLSKNIFELNPDVKSNDFSIKLYRETNGGEDITFSVDTDGNVSCDDVDCDDLICYSFKGLTVSSNGYATENYYGLVKEEIKKDTITLYSGSGYSTSWNNVNVRCVCGEKRIITISGFLAFQATSSITTDKCKIGTLPSYYCPTNTIYTIVHFMDYNNDTFKYSVTLKITTDGELLLPMSISSGKYEIFIPAFEYYKNA